MEDRRGTFRVLVGRHVEKRPLGRPRHRWDENIKISGMGRHGLDLSG
jgi:hypothetical protein